MTGACPRCGPQYADETTCPCELRRRADRITWTLLYSELPRVDVEIAIQALRDWVREHLPDRLRLFEMVYEARWARFREQGWEKERPET